MTLISKTRWMIPLAGVILLTVCGCSSVTSKRAVGAQPASITASQWEGDWHTRDGAVRVKVIDVEKGILKAFWIDDDRQGNPVMRSTRIELRESEGWLFANAEDEKGRGYVWGRIKNEDGQILFWPPDDGRFSHLIKDGTLPGKVEANHILLEELKPGHLKIITSAENGLLFQWDQPTIFVKAGN